MTSVSSCWQLAPEGAAVHIGERTAVIADVHLGYEWSRGAGGDMVPAHSLAETVSKLSRLLDRHSIDRLVVAGDLVESTRPCPRTSRDVRALRQGLGERGVELIWLRGNHDPPRRPALPASIEVDGWLIAHGHLPLAGDRIIVGHHHPVLRASGVVAPCFLHGPSLIALPAFSANAAGLNVLADPAALPAIFRDEALIVVACARDEVLDFGPRGALATEARLESRACR